MSMHHEAIERYLVHLVDVVEGPKYTDNPADSGGPTKYGITLKTLQRWRGRPVTAADVRNLTRAEALDIYRMDYVRKPGYLALAQVSVPIALECIDTGVNADPGTATTFLQRMLNVLNDREQYWPDIKVDGDCGPHTISATETYLSRRGDEGESIMVVALNCLQGAYYTDLAERREKDETFIYGWLRQRIQLSPLTKFYQ